MRRRVRDQHDHLTRRRPPIHIQSLSKRSRDSFRSISATGGIQSFKLLRDFRRIRREPKVPCDVGVILWGMVAKGDQPYAKIFWVDETFGRVDGLVYLFDVFGG